MMVPMTMFWLKMLKADGLGELRSDAVSLYEDEPTYLVQLSTAVLEVTVYMLTVRLPEVEERETETERHGERH